MIRYKFLIEYNGYNYNGWQKQSVTAGYKHKCIQQVLEEAIKSLTQQNVSVVAAGRTDAKVHALGQVAHVDLAKQDLANGNLFNGATQQNWPVYKLMHGINFYLKGHDIAIYNVEEIGLVTEDNKTTIFHARFSAKQREYIYKIVNKDYPDILQKHLAWWIFKPLNVTLMQNAAALLIGTHDFSSFRAAGCSAKSAIRTINSITITPTLTQNLDNHIQINITAPAFLYHQVRNIVGIIAAVGLQQISMQQFEHIFKQKDRTLAPEMAPAYGLYFSKVSY